MKWLMLFKEIILGIVSVSALILSVLNLQYVLFGETNDVKAIVLKFKMCGHYDKDNNNFSGDNFFDSRIAFVNNGNRSVVISDVSLGFHTLDKKNFSDQEMTHQQDSACDILDYGYRCSGHNEPIVLKPGEIVLKEFVFGNGNLEKELYGRFFYKEVVSVEERVKICVDLRFVVIDTSGKKNVIYNDLINIGVRGRGEMGIIISYSTYDESLSKSISLLSTKKKTYLDTYLQFLVPDFIFSYSHLLNNG